MGDVAIGTHYFDLRRISNEQDGDRGEEGGTSDTLSGGRGGRRGQEWQSLGRMKALRLFLSRSRLFTYFWPRVDQPVRLGEKRVHRRRHAGAQRGHRRGRVLQVGVK